jgi:nucleoside-diphosphate-sugar epimerase
LDRNLFNFNEHSEANRRLRRRRIHRGDNALILKLLGWEPSISLKSGPDKTYAWIFEQMQA